MRWHLWISLVLQILFLPAALMALLLSPNEYATQGLLAVDCDGPLVIVTLAISTYGIYGWSFAVYLYAFRKNKKRRYLPILLICGIITVFITPNVIAALKEHHINVTVNVEKCGNGW